MKKGQIRITETIAVLFIFFVLIVFGLLFYYQYQKTAIKERAREFVGARAIETTTAALFLPELICSKGEAEPEDNCFDAQKLRSVSEVIERNLDTYYFELFGFSKISVETIYPPGQDSIVVYDQPKVGAPNVAPTFFVITLRDVDDQGNFIYSLGVLKVEVYYESTS